MFAMSARKSTMPQPHVKYQFYVVLAMLSVPKLLRCLCQLLSKMLDDGNTCKYKNSQNFLLVITPISYRGTNRCMTSVQSQTWCWGLWDITQSLSGVHQWDVSLVRPHLDSPTQVWAPQSKELICKTEQIQRWATKYILNLPVRNPIKTDWSNWTSSPCPINMSIF